MRLDEFAVLFEGVGRETASELLAEALRELEQRADYYRLVRTANIYWRLGEWSEAVGLASRALTVEPRGVLALRILAHSQSQLGHWDACRDSATQLLAAPRTNWVKVRRFPFWLLPLLIFPKARSRFRWWKQQAAIEESAEARSLEWARRLTSTRSENAA